MSKTGTSDPIALATWKSGRSGTPVTPNGMTAGVPLRPVFHVASAMGSEVPVFDIAQRSGDSDLLVRTSAQGDALAETLGPRRVALMRGHGCVVAMGDLRAAGHTAAPLEPNAPPLLQARNLGWTIAFRSRYTAVNTADRR